MAKFRDVLREVKKEASEPPKAPTGGDAPGPTGAKVGLIDTTGIEEAKNKVLNFFNGLFGLRKKSTQQFSQEQQKELNILQDTLKKKGQENQLNNEESVQLLREALAAGIIDQQKFNEAVKTLRGEDLENLRANNSSAVENAREKFEEEKRILQDSLEAKLIAEEEFEILNAALKEQFRLELAEAEIEDLERKKALRLLDFEDQSILLASIAEQFGIFGADIENNSEIISRGVSKTFAKGFKDIGTGASKSFAAMAVDGKSFGKQMDQVFKNVAKTALASLADILQQVLLNSIITLAINKKTATKEILVKGKQAAAGAYNAVVGIPIVGPILAPIAAAVALAAVAAFGGGLQKGSDFLPSDGFQFLHAGEAVIPAESNRDLRDFLAREQEGEAGGFGGGGVIVNVEIESFSGSEDEAQRLAEIVSEQVELRSFEFGRA